MPARKLALALAVGLAFGGVLALRAAVTQPNAAVAFLLGLPIGVAALAFGTRAGLAAAGLALGLVSLQTELRGMDIDTVGYATRAVVFFSAPLLVLAASGKRPRDEVPTLEPTPRPSSSNDQSRPLGLTRREQDVLHFLALGYTNAEIASELYLSVRTVESHRARLQRKLGSSSRAELVRFAVKHGLFGSEQAVEEGVMA